MKCFIPLALFLVVTGVASAATTITETFSLSSPSAIPDGNLNGLVQSITPATTIGTLDSISVTLSTTGGWNGDLYAYLWHGGEISILLNRIGRTTANTAGSATSGLTIEFMMSALTDVHSAPGGFSSSVSGIYQPDGRNIHPLSALDTSPRNAGLDVFTGDAAAGEYRLFIADVATGDTATITGWSITLTGEAIPEPSAALLSSLAGLALLLRRKR